MIFQNCGNLWLQFRFRPDLIFEKLKGIPRDVFRFMLIGSLSATDSYQSRNCLQRHYYQNRINFKVMGIYEYMSESFQVSFLGSSMVYLETFFDLYRLGVSIPPCRTKPDFASSQKFRGLYEKSVVMWWWETQRRWIKSKCNWFVFRKHFPKAKLICLSENLKSSQLPMSQIARTLLRRKLTLTFWDLES